MKKEKVFIVLSHKNSLKRNPKTGKCVADQWEVAENIEFVSQLRNKHIVSSSVIADYINKKMVSGSRHGMDDYEKFANYVRSKYTKQMEELDAAYKEDQVKEEESPELIADQFGNVRPRTVFDLA